MGTSVTSDFAHALRFERELTERQQAVLALVAKGLTNAEIAESLEISLDGAKWNVSEILTKLGLATREEAAGFYRWRRSRRRSLARRMAAFGSLGWWKPGLGGAAAAVAVGGGVAAWALLAPSTSQDDEAGKPFYLEARVTQSAITLSEGSILAPAGSRVVIEPGSDAIVEGERVRRWYDDPRHDRTERDIVLRDGGEPTVGFRMVLDGTDAVIEQPWGPITRWSLDLNPPDTHPNMREPGPAYADSVDDLIARTSGEDGIGAVRVAGEEQILGRDTVILEWEAGMPQTSSGRAWIDPERMFVMRVEEQTGSGSRIMEVVELRYGEDQPDDKFVFVKSEGSFETTCATMQIELQDTSGLAVEVPPRGFLRIPFRTIPDGFGSPTYSNGMEVADGRSVCTSTHGHLASAEAVDGFLDIKQDRSVPEVLLPVDRSDMRVIRGSRLAYVSIEPGITAVAWLEDGIGVQLRSNVLDVVELLELAETLVMRE